MSYSSDLLTLIGYAASTAFLAIYLLADPVRTKGLIYAVVPRNHHIKLARILIELKVIVGGYMRGQLITSVAMASCPLPPSISTRSGILPSPATTLR